jgi:hypothetical protein
MPKNRPKSPGGDGDSAENAALRTGRQHRKNANDAERRGDPKNASQQREKEQDQEKLAEKLEKGGNGTGNGNGSGNGNRQQHSEFQGSIQNFRVRIRPRVFGCGTLARGIG